MSTRTARRLALATGIATALSAAMSGAAFAPATASVLEADNAERARTVPAPSPEASPARLPAGPTCRPTPDESAEADPNERLQFGDMRVPRWIVETIRRAADATGVDPAYLMALADKESSFVVEARPSTSSAEGLFQFITGTWLQVFKAHGAKHGFAAEAAAIVSVKGQLAVPDGAARERVLNLRRDPYLSALMAAEMVKRDRALIAPKVGRDLDATDSYLAHFLGANSAGRFMALLGEKPAHSAQKVFPKAARANKSLFYAREGKKVRQLTVAEVYDRIDGMIDDRVERYEGVASSAPVQELLDRLARL